LKTLQHSVQQHGHMSPSHKIVAAEMVEEQETSMRRSSTYDSLNLEDMLLEAEGVNFWNPSSGTLANKDEGYGFGFIDPIPALRTGEMIKPVARRSDGSSLDNKSFGIDPAFLEMRARFSTKRNRTMETMLSA